MVNEQYIKVHFVGLYCVFEDVALRRYSCAKFKIVQCNTQK